MSTALDTAELVLPALTALGGAYAGARWQARTAVDSEVRQAVDDAVRALPRLARAAGNAKSAFISDGPYTSEAGTAAMNALDIALHDAQEIRDRLTVRRPVGDPVSIHFLNALLAVGRTLTALKDPYFWPNERADAYDPQDAARVLEVVSESEDDFGNERTAFIQAAQGLIGPRVGIRERTRRRLGHRTTSA